MSVRAIATIGVAGLSSARRLFELIRQHKQFACRSTSCARPTMSR